MAYNFLDTSAVLHGGLKKYQHAFISPITLTELENIKTSNKKDDQIKYLAREAIRTITTNSVSYEIQSQKLINKLLKQFDFLSDINDHRILCEAELLGRKHGEMVLFLTSDASQYLFATQMPHLYAQLLNESIIEKEEYNGWSKHFLSEKQLERLYSEPNSNILNIKTNEFAEIYHGEELRDIVFWDGNEYRNLKYKDFVAPTGERISPRNIEQKMYLDLLQNDNIPIKLCVGRFGTGKSMFAETWAAHQIQIGKYDKIVFVKNNLSVKGAGDLGILPGDEIDKQYPWLRQIEDHLGPQLFEQYLNDGRLEPAHLSTLRGRDLKNSIILVDEAENLLITNIQLLLGRVSQGSQIIFCADTKQCDYKDEKMSGIPKMIEKLSGNPLFGMIRLVKSERSVVAATADLLD